MTALQIKKLAIGDSRLFFGKKEYFIYKTFMMKIILLFFLTIIFQDIFASDITVVTMAIGKEYQKIVQPGIENKRDYCLRHGYEFIYGEHSLDVDRPLPWTKVPQILQAMENPDCKWIFWTDADSVIMNHSILIEDLIDEQYDFILCKDPQDLNTGQFLLRNCDWSRSFLNDVYAHTEYIHHPIWENQAIIWEYYHNPVVKKHTKLIPQRLMNSYAKEVITKESCMYTYQPGDFVVHFAGLRDKERLRHLMDYYSKRVITNDEELFSLPYYLSIYCMQNSVNEAYLSPSQKKQFNQLLESHPDIKSIVEIGFNAGHSAENFFTQCKKLEKFVSFDINQYTYTRVSIEFMHRKYKERFTLIEGNSLITVPEYAKHHHGETFDLIYIDTNRGYTNCLNDILNCRVLATPDTFLWIDDYVGPVREAVQKCIENGIIKIGNVHSSYDIYFGPRVWVEAHYENTVH